MSRATFSFNSGKINTTVVEKEVSQKDIFKGVDYIQCGSMRTYIFTHIGKPPFKIVRIDMTHV